MEVLYFFVVLWDFKACKYVTDDVLLQCLTSRGVVGLLCNVFPQPIHYLKVNSSASDGVC